MDALNEQTPLLLSACDRMLILGISVFGHDSSCALIDAASGDILYALTEERFSNLKHDGGFPAASLALLMGKIDTEKLGCVSHVALNTNPAISIVRLKVELLNCLSAETAQLVASEFDQLLAATDIFHPDYFPLNYLEALLARRGVEPAVIAHASGKINWYGNFALRHSKLKDYLQSKFPRAEIVSVGHHQCHAASTFYCSDFENAAVLTVDGQGEYETITLSIARGTEIRLLSQTRWPNSLGELYTQLAWYLGFDGDPRYPGQGDEYKVMGMAAYGKPIYADIFREMGRVSEKGELELVFGQYLESAPVEGCPGHFKPLLSKLFFKALGERRSSCEPIEQRHYDIARSGQTFLEETGVAIAKHLKTLCPETDNLCIAGGVGLNGLMNMRILREAGFSRIFVQPASGDDGTSLGAALHVYHILLKGKRCKPLANAYLGFDYGNHAIHSALEKYNLAFHKPESIHFEMGRLLHDGNIVARYFGRGEFGPRALGHRSILANPTLPEMKDAVNARIKHRESFRPFAPACLEERASEYFDIDIPTAYMLLICQARSATRLQVPAVVHDDGTARLQTVRSDLNSDFYKTIYEFNKQSGVPILLNTSFNVNGETIVETPQDAIESFLFMGIDYLAIGPYLVSRTENEATYLRPTREKHIQDRQDRYIEKYFSREIFLWSTGNPIETDLVLLKKQAELYRKSADDRMTIIEQLDAEIKRLNEIQNELTSMHQLLEEKEAVIEEKEAVIRIIAKTLRTHQIIYKGTAPFRFIVRMLRRSFEIVMPRLGNLNQYAPRPISKKYANTKKSLSYYPVISIATPSFAHGEFIEKTLLSVLNQKYPNLEFFVQDGGSKDSSVEILKKYQGSLSGWVSEKDSGQSQAINLGLAKTSGEIMGWLNSDDLLLPGALHTVADYFNRHPDVDAVYGNRLLIDVNDMEIGRWIMPGHDSAVLSWVDYVPQETMFWRRRIWDKVGGQIDESFRFAMDWDLLLRFREAGAKFKHIPQFLGAFRIHEHQKTTALINDIGHQEMDRIRHRVLGRVPSHKEIRAAILPYLLKHIAIDMLYRVKTRLGVNA